MARQTREEKRAEEARIIAEMDAALQENGVEVPKTKPQRIEPTQQEVPKEKIYCKRCKTLMENGVCPTCGYKVYVPMDEGKRKRIRLVVAAVSIVVFLVLFFTLR